MYFTHHVFEFFFVVSSTTGLTVSSDGGDCKYNTNTIYNILQEYARFKILCLDQFVGI